jgi:cytochrome b subunit of formate dehydrogenase/nitrate/TMAO reductase-like tetraheme cytochrome c subunit
MNKVISTLKISTYLLVLLSIVTVATAQTAPIFTPSNSECISCHEKKISTHAYNASVHRSLLCTACHIKDETKQSVALDLSRKKICIATFKPMNCSSCHNSIVKEHEASIHNAKRLPVTCAKCHADIHNITSIKNDKITSARLCGQCHKKESAYFKSIHFQALLKGDNDAPGCIDCHGLHAIKKIDNIEQGRAFHTQACLKCHADANMMARNKVTTVAPETYFESYHGKSMRLGYPDKGAGCADCHGTHNILPEMDTNSTVNEAHLASTCKQCHVNARKGFAKFIPHADANNHSKFPLLFWVTLSMNILLVSVFMFFWIHSILWAFRGFIEKKQARNAALFSNAASQSNGNRKTRQKVYRRFRPYQIVLHLFVVTSFLGLALTGLPLKFNQTLWGKSLMDFFGGTANAGFIHRICATITFGYLFVALVLSIRFLFSKKLSNESFYQRLFGPDSLFPNRKDFRDIRAMFRWFFFRGPKPKFDRWTYWEKFDFLAVFWGVTVIGSSGLLLWFPEFFGKFLPGWFFNVATIIHSDEALLAVGFIFTIHFFNTHFRFEKFPMDFVIFNGQVTEEEMIHERSEQWKRYQQQGITKDFEVHKPTPIIWEIAMRVFGLLAVLTGIILALLIIYTFIA